MDFTNTYISTCSEPKSDLFGRLSLFLSGNHEKIRDKAALVFRDPARQCNDTERLFFCHLCSEKIYLLKKYDIQILCI